MVNLLLKLLLCPGVIFIASAVFPGVNYALSMQIIYTGVFLAILSYIMDLLLLKRMGSASSSIVDGLVAVVVVYLSQYFTIAAFITFTGALLTGVLLGISEYLTHRLIVSENFRESEKPV